MVNLEGEAGISVGGEDLGDGVDVGSSSENKQNKYSIISDVTETT